jgi:hypothetical protein
MGLASGLPLAAETVPSALFCDEAKGVEPQYVEDEEFPSNLPLKYDRMLQPASRPSASRVLIVVAAMVAVLLILVSAFLVFNSSNASPSVFASPPSSR